MKFDFLIEEYLLNKVDAETLKNSIKQYFKKLLNEYKFREIEYLKFYPFISDCFFSIPIIIVWPVSDIFSPVLKQHNRLLLQKIQ